MTGDLIKSRARELEPQLISFLRDIIAIESLSGREQAVVRRVEQEMQAVGFDEVKIDPLGNILGRVGHGPRVLAFDAHLDTVGKGDLSQWACDPLQGKLADGLVFGRGSTDQKAGMAAMVYAAMLMKELGLLEGWQVWMVGSVMEEDCDGLCWHYILSEKLLLPEVVVSTEPTNLGINVGQRGRLEIRVRTQGRSCHGSMPHLGDNAIYKLAPAIKAIEDLNPRLRDDPFLGKGTCTVTWIGCQSPSLCAVPDQSELHIDRRLTRGETRASALAEIESALAAVGVQAEVYTPVYEEPAWTGLVYPMDKYYPTWVLAEDHPAVSALQAAVHQATGTEAALSRWNFSTNGVAIMGLHDVPCLGFGPGQEELAHSPNEHVPVSQVVSACAVYAALPRQLAEKEWK